LELTVLSPLLNNSTNTSLLLPHPFPNRLLPLTPRPTTNLAPPPSHLIHPGHLPRPHRHFVETLSSPNRCSTGPRPPLLQIRLNYSPDYTSSALPRLPPRPVFRMSRPGCSGLSSTYCVPCAINRDHWHCQISRMRRTSQQSRLEWRAQMGQCWMAQGWTIQIFGARQASNRLRIMT
jgi:hypothetical protein